VTESERIRPSRRTRDEVTGTSSRELVDVAAHDPAAALDTSHAHAIPAMMTGSTSPSDPLDQQRLPHPSGADRARRRFGPSDGATAIVGGHEFRVPE
jgi:hypothetical protein